MHSLDKISVSSYKKNDFVFPEEMLPNDDAIGSFHRKISKLATRVTTLSFNYFAFLFPAMAISPLLTLARAEITAANSLQSATEIPGNVVDFAEAVYKTKEKGLRYNLHNLIKKTSDLFDDFGYVACWFATSIVSTCLDIKKTRSHYLSNKKVADASKLENYPDKAKRKLLNSIVSLSRTLLLFTFLTLQTTSLIIAATVLKSVSLALVTAILAIDLFTHHLDKAELDPNKNFIYKKLTHETVYTL